jgi:general secretion pathway protein K
MKTARILPAHRQRGAAVIAALIVVAIVAALCSSLFLRQTSTIRQIENEEARIQARWLLQSGIDWARLILREHLANEATTQGDQIWATPIQDSRLTQPRDDRVALFSGRLQDEQGKYNLYNLATNGIVVQEQAEILQRLLSNLNLPSTLTKKIVELIVEAQPRNGTAQGADFYSGQSATSVNAGITASTATPASTTPTTDPSAGSPSTASAPLPRSIDDIANLLQVDDATRFAMNRAMTVLPAPTFVNVNTAAPEVIAAITPGLSLSQARSLAGDRDRGQWFINNSDFANRLTGTAPTTKVPAVVTTSSWYMATGTVAYERARVTLRALLSSAGGTPRTLWTQETQ